MKPEILKQNTDFRRLYKRGASHANPVLVVYTMRNRTGLCRIGITSSKKIGNAVERNRSRRLIRAAFQEVYKQHEAELQGYDIVFVARVRTRYRKSTELVPVMIDCLQKTNVLRGI
jgi:ribonuclease P protein component